MASFEPGRDLLRDVAAAHLARTLAADAVAAAIDLDDERPLRLADLLAYATRSPDQPASFALERTLRGDDAALGRYRRVLAALSSGHSPVALAAASGQVVSRQAGPFRLSLHAGEADAAPALVIAGPMAAGAPQSIEVHDGDERVRLGLPAPIGAQIAILLDPDRGDTAALDRLLRRPTSEIFLV